MRGLYIHVPFCVRKCAYCDFYSLPERLDLLDAYVSAVLQEAESYNGLFFHTLYLGGGTPSLLGDERLRRLVGGLRCAVDLSDLVEATIEVNPESASVELLQAAMDVGINRVSIGVQSLSDRELERVGRVHTVSEAIETIVRTRKIGFRNVSADVIVGLPGQEWATLRPTLETLTGLGINHLSLYCLLLEQGMPLAVNPPDDLPSDDAQAELFEQAREFLGDCEFNHYEISNFALSGHECCHNLNYWRGGEYLGLGPAAFSHLQGKRFNNSANLEAYIQNPTGLVEEVEELEASGKAIEEAMLRLRLLSEGLVGDELIKQYGRANTWELIRRLDVMVAEGLLTFEGSTYRLARSRVLTSNPIFARVLGGG